MSGLAGADRFSPLLCVSTSSPNPVDNPFPCLGQFFISHALISILLNTWEDPVQISAVLCAALSALAFYLMNSSCLIPPDSQSCLNSEYSLALPQSHFPMPWPGNPPKAVSPDNCRAHLICFLFLGDRCHSLPDVQRLENCCFLYCSNVNFLALGIILWLCQM